MNTRRQYRKSSPPQQMFVIINREGEVYTGLLNGYTQWSYDWKQAKPLHVENTTRLLEENMESELIKEEEII